MDLEWLTSPAGRRVLAHWADPRPAWLWSHDGATLLWRNNAARLFNGRVKKGSLKLSPDPMPIKGLVGRLIRLGSPGRSTLSRVQFLSAGHPSAATCASTPLSLADGEMGLLLVAVDPISQDVLESAGPLAADALTRRLLPAGTDFTLLRDGTVVDGSDRPADGPSARIAADSRGSELLLYAATAAEVPAVADVRSEEGLVADEAEHDLADTPEPLLPLGLTPLPVPPEPSPPEGAGNDWVDVPPLPPERSLTSLFDRLADDASLYTALTAADEQLGGVLPDEPSNNDPSAVSTSEPDLIAAVIEYSNDADDVADTTPRSPSQWMITGRGFRAASRDVEEPAPVAPPPEEPPATEPVGSAPDLPAQSVVEPPAVPIATIDAAPDAETAKRVSRYNFEELGRILSDRVSADEGPGPVVTPEARPTQGVVSLNAETLVLNRLPLAILVFRDQHVLFANRALTDLLGYDGIESLRSAGIAAIFPSEEASNAGPVNRLVRRDGSALPVTARLQSVSWQGRAALMLSASPAEAVRTHEGAVRSFARIAADARHEGFLAADRAGLVTEISAAGATALASERDAIVGRPLAVLVAAKDMDVLRAFLEKPARFAETARPSLVVSSESGDAQIVLFAEGQAGMVQGYFGFVRARPVALPEPDTTDEPSDPAMFGRLSRGIRRPLNTIIGFADLIRSAAMGSMDAARYGEYARDIRTAGLEIAVLVDELDDYARLRGGGYESRPANVELAALLESCIARVRSQASAARVLVRSAVAEKLPRIRADEASLTQALLNLLASAIDQTPVGGSVILSAQLADDGGISIHVRDGAQNNLDLAERFVVFRDGVDMQGEQLQPVRSSVGLALTRSLLAVNACSLTVDPVIGAGTLFSLAIPAELVGQD